MFNEATITLKILRSDWRLHAERFMKDRVSISIGPFSGTGVMGKWERDEFGNVEIEITSLELSAT